MTATLTNATKHSATLSNATKNTAVTFTGVGLSGLSKLLLETGDYLLQESGFKFLIEPISGASLTDATKS